MSDPPSEERPDPRLLAAAVVSAVGWATPGLFIRLLGDAPPLAIVLGRYGVGLLLTVSLVAAWRLVVGSRETDAPAGAALRAERLRLWWLAVLMAAYYALATPSFLLTSVAEATLLINISPAFTLLIAAFRRERLGRRRLAGALLALAGVAVIVAPGLVGSGGDRAGRLIGDLLAAASAVTVSVYADGLSRLERRGVRVPATAATARAFVAGLLLVGPYVLLTTPAALPALVMPPRLWPVLGLAAVSTVVPTVCYSVASGRLPPLATTSFRLLTPVLAAVLAWAFLGEELTVAFGAGATLVLAGLWLVAR